MSRAHFGPFLCPAGEETGPGGEEMGPERSGVGGGFACRSRRRYGAEEARPGKAGFGEGEGRFWGRERRAALHLRGEMCTFVDYTRIYARD